jgi:hypothetical protein
MKDLANTYLNTLVPMVVEQTNRGERALCLNQSQSGIFLGFRGTRSF